MIAFYAGLDQFVTAEYRDQVDGRAVEPRDAHVMRGKSADRYRRKRVTERVEPPHAGQAVSEHARDREREVDIPESLRWHFLLASRSE